MKQDILPDNIYMVPRYEYLCKVFVHKVFENNKAFTSSLRSVGEFFFEKSNDFRSGICDMIRQPAISASCLIMSG